MTESRGATARRGAGHSAPAPRRALENLARRCGVAVSYLDQAGDRRRAAPETLLAVLGALGEHLEDPGATPGTLAEVEARGRGAGRDGGPAVGRRLPAMVIAWEGRTGAIGPIPATAGRQRGGAAGAELVLDPEAMAPPSLSGEERPRRHSATGGSGGRRSGGDAAGGEVVAPRVSLLAGERGLEAVIDGVLPYGMHELRIELGGDQHLVRVLAAPRRAGAPPGYRPGGWGVFAPAYSIADERQRPAGDLTTLRRLGELMAQQGATVVATLPLLAELASIDGASPGQSPYSPLSRMWWNEAYLDLARLPELAGVALPAELAGAVRLRSGASPALADLASIAGAGRPLLAQGAARLEAGGGPRRTAFRRFVRARPDVMRYARYRAAIELHGADRSRWPAAWRRGRIPANAVPEDVVARHSYAQWAMDDQLAADAALLAERGCGYMLDLPIGCRSDGYDPWAFPDAFATGASVGAPPDTFFPEGQNWGFPPPHPEGDRRAGYPMLRACLGHSLAHAAALRIDHVLGWSRLWWVPRGMPASAGAYVHYRLDELLAVACLESHRHASRMIGEDLGTVEPALQRALRAHDVAGMRVAVFDLDAAPEQPLDPPTSSVAYVDTHDTATFAGFLDGHEVDLRESLGLLETTEARQLRARRSSIRRTLEARLRLAGALPTRHGRQPAAALSVLAGVLEELGRSAAELVIVNIEDLWGETDPHNVPGTSSQHANFARRFERTLEDIEGDGDLLAMLGRLDAARKERLGASGASPAPRTGASKAKASRVGARRSGPTAPASRTGTTEERDQR